MNTEDRAYAERLRRVQSVWWKRLLDVQRPYREHLRRLRLGRTLEVGCGIGRNLLALGRDGVGVDHNEAAVAMAVERGLCALEPAAFAASAHARPASFDALLLSHVAEHLRPAELDDLLARYLVYLRPGGRVVLITPQEAGYRSDPTHVTFMDFERLDVAIRRAGLAPLERRSFPFPRVVGRFFKYNEFVAVALKPG